MRSMRLMSGWGVAYTFVSEVKDSNQCSRGASPVSTS